MAIDLTDLPSSDASTLISAGFEFKYTVAVVPLEGLHPDPGTDSSDNIVLANDITDNAESANQDARDSHTRGRPVHYIKPVNGCDVLFVNHSPVFDKAENSINECLPAPFNRQACAQDEVLQNKVYRIVAETVSSVPNQTAKSLQDLSSQGVSDADFWRKGWIVKKANSAFVAPNEKPTLEALHPHVCFVPIEMCSPILSWGEKDGPVWEGMQKVIQTLRHTYTMVTNPRCDFHVHLGRVDGRAFCLPTMKRLAVLLWLAEDIMRSVRDFRFNDFDGFDKAGATINNMSRLARGLEIPADLLTVDDPVAGTGPTAPGAPTHEPNHEVILGMAETHADDKTIRALREILNAPSHLYIGLLLSGTKFPYRRLGMNFSSFGREDERARNEPRTVELRVLEDTYDEKLLTAWLHMACTVVEVAVDDSIGESRFEKTVEFLLSLGKTSLASSQKMEKFSRHLGLSEKHTYSLSERVKMVE